MVSSEAETQKTSGCPIDHEKLLAEGSLTDPVIHAQPSEYYRALRTKEPLHFDSTLGQYVLSRYDDIVEVLRDPDTYSIEQGYQAQYAQGFFEEFKEIIDREGGGFVRDLIISDPPYHTRIRKLMEKAFTAHRVKQLEPGITSIAVNLLGKILDKGKAEVVKDFAVPLASGVICEQFGVSHLPPETIQKWSHALSAQVGRMQSHEEMVENARNICELQNFLNTQIEDRRKNPKEDMITDLVQAKPVDPSEPPLTDKEIMALARAMLGGGNETIITAIGNLFFYLATRPDLARELYENADDDRYVTRFVEELLRMEPPVIALSRMTTKDVELCGTALPKGTHILLLWGSANDDESAFPCPREFDPKRENLGSHLTFGAGIHRCVGSALARMEIKVAAREIVKRMVDITLDLPIEDIRYVPTIATHSIASLPITFSKR